MTVKRTLSLIKPDAAGVNRTGAIVHRFKAAGRWEVDRVALGYVTMSLHLLLPLGLLWVVYAAGGYAMRGLDALGPSADPTGIGVATRVSTGGMARNISRR